ncbi:MAG: hypothetical protein WCJ94_06825 [bacterium]
MKHIITMCLFSLLITSCISTGPFKQDFATSRAVVHTIDGTPFINIYRQVDLNTNSIIGTLKPGDSILIIKKTSTAALVKLTTGSTGWIDIKALNNNE